MAKDTDSLQGLIDQAKQSLPKPKPAGGNTGKANGRVPVAVMAVALAVFVWGWQYWSSAISAEQVHVDLKTLISQARSQIDREQVATGRLPSALADHTLAKVIRYEIVDGAAQPPKYRLFAELGGVSESWSSE